MLQYYIQSDPKKLDQKLFAAFIFLLVLNLLFGIYFSRCHPEPIYDEAMHMRDIVRFAKLGWTDEAFLERQNYAGTLAYLLPSYLYRASPS